MIAFITQKDFIRITGISPQMDFGWLGENLDQMQLLKLKPCIGDAFYNELEIQIDTNTLTPVNDLLLETYMKRYIAYQTYADSIRQMHIRPQPKGLMVNKDETADPASEGSVVQFQRAVQNKADAFLIAMQRFLRENKTDYPLFESDCGSGKCKTNFPIFTGYSKRLQ